MEDTQDVAATNGALPRVVVADPNEIALTPNEMRALKAATGRPMSDVFTEGNEEDAMQAVIWLALRRQGYDPSWAEAGDVALQPVTEPSDPTPTNTSPGSPPSVVSGG